MKDRKKGLSIGLNKFKSDRDIIKLCCKMEKMEKNNIIKKKLNIYITY